MRAELRMTSDGPELQVNLWKIVIALCVTWSWSDFLLQAFADELLALGEGRTEKHQALGNDVIEVDPKFLISKPSSRLPSEDVDDLIDWVFPDLPANCTDPDWLFGRAILTPKNDTVDMINDMLTARFPGQQLCHLHNLKSVHEMQYM